MGAPRSRERRQDRRGQQERSGSPESRSWHRPRSGSAAWAPPRPPSPAPPTVPLPCLSPRADSRSPVSPRRAVHAGSCSPASATRRDGGADGGHERRRGLGAAGGAAARCPPGKSPPPQKIILGVQTALNGPEPLSRVAQIPALGQEGVLQELLLGEGQSPDPGISEEQQQAREEWEALEDIQSGLGGTSGSSPPPISFTEALQHFQSAELSGSRGKVRAPRRRGILGALLRWLCGPPRLQPQLREEQELALAMAHCALDNSERVHMRILQTIYQQLTRSRLGCPRYGAHWEELGFQGADPGTDLRGTGMLGLMQILFFVLDSRLLPLAREIFQLSQHETQNFPFCIMSVNITRIVIQALQEERLSRECNRRQQVIGVLNDLYAAAFLRLSCLWKQQHGTVTNASFFLKELELSTKKKPRQLLKSLEAYLSCSLQPPSPPSSQIHFSSICDAGVELEGDSRLI